MLKKTTNVNSEKKLNRGSRPRRGAPAETRERLIAAAARLFNRVGYYGTDSNRIAREAGYSPGTFYKHFREKRDIFLAAYEGWIVSEWEAFQAELALGGEPQDLARRLVELQVDFHTRWRGLRASLLELVFADAVVRRFYRDQRRRQLDLMAQLRTSLNTRHQSREEDAIHIYTMERSCDAIAQGELANLGLDKGVMIEVLVQRVASLLKQ
jgi:AcrR family transcriptional regulator